MGTIDSFGKLELVLALVRAPAAMTVADLARVLDLAPDEVRGVATELAHGGLVTIESAGAGQTDRASEVVRLAPNDADAAALAELAVLYDEDCALVVKTLSTIAMDRIRGMAARRFADAFRLRKRKDGDDG